MAHSSDLIADDIEAYLQVHENKDMLRFITCGSVDDGKSTLIGRLLYDSKMIFEDQMAAIEKDSQRFNTTNDDFDLSLLVDGLQSEREQGITIDVAYRYFSTEQRKFIIADTPGHEQYTRNMATGASTCDLAVILIDARHGVQTQTRRHSFICSLLGIKHVIVAVNKMDLVDYSQDTYKKIKAEYREFAEDLNFADIRFVPMSALRGDNVVNNSENMAWYPGATLMRLLNSVDVQSTASEFNEFRLPVQYVNRPNLDFRGFAGTIAAGDIRVGDRVLSLPSGKESKVKQIITFDGELEQASQGMAITLTLEDEIDCSRGDMLVRPNQRPLSSESVAADVVWMDDQPLAVDRDYVIKLGTCETVGHAKRFEYKVDVNSLAKSDAAQLDLNEIGRVVFDFDTRVLFDLYQQSRRTGSFIIIDKLTNNTVGAGMIAKAVKFDVPKPLYSEQELELNAYVRKHYPHWGVKDISKL
ncbi:sulfate adenylyltransferase subunit CysN [Umboniibacter marinipuniceus]|uniref:Sulfate adenylyltransferase subunit 1 n=1 Tax=Umboniibacter marinipuniceus TaxID=569599 RepID=A0A3M0A9L5_9GAMM|nr:sulfate adenylyltransferase subunit CysN [Umboniibacter marinipuniceus]RMA79528.1 sulfate adenylyltransferase subunit 1 [Umboniibacter marinipuniceus]